MLTYTRSHFNEVLDRLREKPERILIIRGPRQCGKTTLIRQVLETIRQPWQYISIEDPTASMQYPENISAAAENGLPIGQSQFTQVNTDWFVRKWLDSRKQASLSEHGAVLVVDEIQKLANWSETVKGLWDSDKFFDRRLHVVLLGSSPLLLQRGISESLAGRFEEIRLSHWSFEEMSDAFGFSLEQFVYFGGYPGAASLIENEVRWRNYVRGSLVETAIERDALAMQRIDKPALLRQLAIICSTYSGQIVSYNKMLGQLNDAGNTTTLANYLFLLREVGLIAGLSKFSVGEIRRRASSPKLIVMNSALISAYSNFTFKEAQNDRSHWGRMVESAVGAHLMSSGDDVIDVNYWRENNDEVDFVLRRGQELIPIEVKSGKQQRGLQGLDIFCNRYDVLQRIVVGTNGIPLSEFLTTPVLYWFEQ